MSNLAVPARPRRVTRQREAGAATRRETRRRVLAAAQAEFAEHGYHGATVSRIADRADVAVPTLYAAWSSKRALLRAVMGQAVTGHPGGFDSGSDRNDLLGSVNPDLFRDTGAFLAYLAHRYRLIAERSAVGWRTYRDAAAVDPELAADWQALHDGRRDTFAALLANLPQGAFRPGLTLDFAADTIWAVASPETHELFVLRRRWTYDQYEQWVTATLQAALTGGTG